MSLLNRLLGRSEKPAAEEFQPTRTEAREPMGVVAGLDGREMRAANAGPHTGPEQRGVAAEAQPAAVSFSAGGQTVRAQASHQIKEPHLRSPEQVSDILLQGLDQVSFSAGSKPLIKATADRNIHNGVMVADAGNAGAKTTSTTGHNSRTTYLTGERLVDGSAMDIAKPKTDWMTPAPRRTPSAGGLKR